MKFTIENESFFNNYIEMLENFSEKLFINIIDELTEDKEHYYSHYFNKEEIGVFIMINKVFFQNIFSFFHLIKLDICYAAFNNLRTAIENARLFRVLYLYDDFRKDYMSNDIYDTEKPEYRFMQKKINEKLESEEKYLRMQNKIPLSCTLQNHHFTKNSALSGCHSELSKWSHLLNVNMIVHTELDNLGIKLSLENDNNEKIQDYILKYCECTFYLIQEHASLFKLTNNDYKQFVDEMFKLHNKFVDLRYK